MHMSSGSIKITELCLINIQLTGHAFGSGVAVWGELIPVLKFKGHAGRISIGQCLQYNAVPQGRGIGS